MLFNKRVRARSELINLEYSMNVLTIKNGNAKIKMKIKLIER